MSSGDGLVLCIFDQDASRLSGHPRRCVKPPIHLFITALLTFHFIGWSFGGVVAFEVACQLRAAGRQVGGVILIDSPYPVNHKPLPELIIAHVAGGLSKNAGAEAIRQQVLTQFRHNAAMLGKYQPQPSGLENVKFCYLRSRNTFDSEGLCGVRYPWLSDQEERTNAINSWKTLVGHDIQVLDIPGNHFEVLASENVSRVITWNRRYGR